MNGSKLLHDAKIVTAFSLYPRKIRFENQDTDEEVILLLRRHIITTVPWVFAGIVMIFVPFLFPSFFGYLKTTLTFTVPTATQLVVVVVWYLLTMGFVIENFLIWYYNVYLITNKRVIDVDFHGVMYKSISEAPLSRVQDVTYNMGGFMQVVFNYGMVFVQTAGEVQNIEFESVPHPDQVVRKIGEIIHLERLHWNKEGTHERQ